MKKLITSLFVLVSTKQKTNLARFLTLFVLLVASKAVAQSSAFTTSTITACSGLPITFEGITSCSSITQSLNLSGTGAASSTLVSTATDNFTVELWVKFNPNSDGYQSLFYNGSSGGNGFGIYVLPSGQLLILNGGVGFVDLNISLTPGTWQHLAIVRNAGTWYSYLNGVEYATNDTTSPNTPVFSTSIGCNINGDEKFNGTVSQVAFWNTVRTKSQIQADMQACTFSGSELAAYWSLDGTATDLSGNGHDLSLSNTTYSTDNRYVPPTGGAQYLFDFGDGNTYTSNVGNASHTFTSGANYTVSLTVTYNGSSSTSTQSVTVIPSTVAGTISADQTITSPTGTGFSTISGDQNLIGDYFAFLFPRDQVAQSFKASLTASWTSLNIDFNQVLGPGEIKLKIFSGNGVNGTSLLSQTVIISNRGVNTITFSSPIAITAGQFYTFRITSNGAMVSLKRSYNNELLYGTFYQYGSSNQGTLFFKNTYQINNANWNNLTLTGNTGTILYWQQASDLGFSNPTNIANTSATLYSGTIGNLSATTYFRAVVQSGSCDVLNTNTVTISAAKVTPTITTNPTASSIVYGQTLASSTLSAGVASVDGTFAFTTPSTSPSVGTANQDYTFTPTDTTNYDTVTGTVSVTVSKATPSITSAPTASSIVYGQTLASSTLSAGVASVDGTFAFTTPVLHQVWVQPTKTILLLQQIPLIIQQLQEL